LIVDEAVDRPLAGYVLIGKIPEIEAIFQQFVFVDRGLTIRVQASEDTPIFPQNSIYIAHKIGLTAILAIVMGTTAIIGTEAFILSSRHFFTTNDTALFFRGGHAD